MTLKNPEQKSEHNKSQCGSAIFYILIVVILFAALGAAVSNMMRGPASSSMSKEKQGIYAAEILSYAQHVRNTVKDLQISNNCEDTDLSFEASNLSNRYEHSPAARDECKIFHSDGGAQPWSLPSAEAFLGSQRQWMFHSMHCVSMVGTGQTSAGCVASAKELMMDIPGLKKDVCIAINDSLGITNPGDNPPTENHSVTTQLFDGTYSDATNTTGLLTTPEIQGYRAGCIQDIVGSYSGLYIFYQVLIAR